jgi:uncharacterized cupin superfamily protein
MNIVGLDPDSGDYEEYFPDAEKRVQGNPKQAVRMHFTDPTGQFMVGTWRSEVGKWTVRYTETEYCELLAGVSVITNEAGQSSTVRPGDRFVVPRGFVGSWEVITPTTKHFVIYESAAD